MFLHGDDAGKYEIRCQWTQEHYISRFQTPLIQFVSDVLYCEQLVKKSTGAHVYSQEESRYKIEGHNGTVSLEFGLDRNGSCKVRLV